MTQLSEDAEFFKRLLKKFMTMVRQEEGVFLMEFTEEYSKCSEQEQGVLYKLWNEVMQETKL